MEVGRGKGEVKGGVDGRVGDAGSRSWFLGLVEPKLPIRPFRYPGRYLLLKANNSSSFLSAWLSTSMIQNHDHLMNQAVTPLVTKCHVQICKDQSLTNPLRVK